MSKYLEIKELETNLKDIRYQLLLKGMELDSLKSNRKGMNHKSIGLLESEILEFQMKLEEVSKTLKNLKFCYYVTYEVEFYNIWSKREEREVYREYYWLNEDLNINLPQNGDWYLEDNQNSSLIMDVLSILKFKYDKVSLKSLQRVNI